MKAILEVHGPAQCTQLQSRRPLVLENYKDDFQEDSLGCNDNKASPSGMVNDTIQ